MRHCLGELPVAGNLRYYLLGLPNTLMNMKPVLFCLDELSEILISPKVLCSELDNGSPAQMPIGTEQIIDGCFRVAVPLTLDI